MNVESRYEDADSKTAPRLKASYAIDAPYLLKSELNAYVDECFACDAELRSKGHLVARGEALQNSRNVVTLRRKNGTLAVTDGPYAETKEQLGGFCVN